MNKIVNKLLLTGDKFLSKFHLKQVGFINRACEPFTKHCKRIQKFSETDTLRHLCRNELDKACFGDDENLRELFQIRF